jgi:hypothetical protein
MKFQGTLPNGDANGLHTIAQALVQRPEETHVIVAVITTKKITKDVDTGDVEATARIVRAEVVSPDDYTDDLETAERLMRRAMERRHGGEMLPIEMEDELTALFERVNREILAEQQDDGAGAAAGDEDADGDTDTDESDGDGPPPAD